MKKPKLWSLLLFTTLLAACDSVSVRIVRPVSEPDDADVAPKVELSLESVYRTLAASGVGPVYALDPAESKVTIFVYRGGAAADQGHDHVISVPQFEGFVLIPPKLSDARFDLQFRLDSMIVDDPALRAETGGEFHDPLSSSAIDATREHMLGAQSLQAEAFPIVHLHALAIEGDLPRLILHLEVTLHGQKMNVDLPLTVTADTENLQAQGSFVLRQSDFGIRPYSVMHGLLKIQDPMTVEFTVHGHLHRFE